LFWACRAGSCPALAGNSGISAERSVKNVDFLPEQPNGFDG
jgi:hypothetical protein